MQEVKTREAFAFILKMISGFRWPIFIMLLSAVASAADLSIRPYLIKIILNRVDEYMGPGLLEYLKYPLIAYFGVAVFITTLYRLYGYFVEIQMIPRLRQKILDTTFSYLLEHSHSYYQNTFSGSLANKVNDLKYGIPDIIQLVIDHFLVKTLGVIIATYTLWHINYKFALVMSVWATVSFGGAIFFSKKIHHLSHHWSEMGTIITGKVVDVLSNIFSVRLFARQPKEKDFLNVSAEGAVKAERKLQWFYFFIWFLYGYFFIFMQVLCFYLLIRGREEGGISIGDFGLVLTMNISIGESLWNLTKDFSYFSQELGKVTQALQIIKAPLEIQDKPGAFDLEIQRGSILFDNVQFYYKGSSPLFDKNTVLISPGQKVGLVGYSGSGKSTFINLLLRIFEINGGNIVIDGQNILNVTQNSLRRNISLIPQDPSLFNRTLMDNIRYGRLDTTDEEVIRAAVQAHAHDFIAKLPHGYNTMVGERGVKLSGGQRQRIAIARAILKNAPILVLDEATSQLDSVTENQIQESLSQLMEGKTTIVIAHRLSTLLHMDRILVFDQGRIVQDGTHEELVHVKGLYHNLWDAQIGGFLPKRRED